MCRGHYCLAEFEDKHQADQHGGVLHPTTEVLWVHRRVGAVQNVLIAKLDKVDDGAFEKSGER
jgi:hypothetical protein